MVLVNIGHFFDQTMVAKTFENPRYLTGSLAQRGSQGAVADGPWRSRRRGQTRSRLADSRCRACGTRRFVPTCVLSDGAAVERCRSQCYPKREEVE